MSFYSKDSIEQLKTIKFFVYLRKSSEDNEDRQIASIPRQIHEVEEQIIKKYRLNVIKPYYQEGQSAFKEGREYFNDLLKRLNNGEGNGVISWHANRLARNYGDGGRFVQTLSDGKIKVVLTCFGFFENTPRDLEYLMTEFTRAARDSGDKSEAVKSGNRERFFEKRQWIGPAKPGYLNVTNPITKEKEIAEDPDRFPLLVKALRLILSGTYTPMQVLDKLNNEWGYRTRKTKRQGGNPMGKSSFYNFLADPYLYGLMVRKEGEIMGEHKSMLTKPEFERLQIILGRRGRPHITKHDFSYKEVLKCAGCGGSITAEEKWQIICPVCKTKFHKGKKTVSCPECNTLIEEMKNPTVLHYIYYHCTKKKNRTCPQGSITLEELEKQIDNKLKRFEIREEFKEWAIKYLNELNDKEVEERHVSLNNAQQALQDTVKRLDNLTKLYISPQNADRSLMTEEEYAAQRKPLLEEKESLTRLTNEIDQRQDDWHELTVKTFNFACYGRYWFGNGDVKTKTEILATLGSNLTIKNKILLIEEHNPFFIIEKGKKEVENLAKKLEPKKELDLTAQNALLEPLRSAWLRG